VPLVDADVWRLSDGLLNSTMGQRWTELRP